MSPSPNGEDTPPSSPSQPPHDASGPQVPPAPAGSPFTAPGPGPDASWSGHSLPGTTAVDASGSPDAYASFPEPPTASSPVTYAGSYAGSYAGPYAGPVPGGAGHDQREHRPGTNGLAIAALCCGIAGFVPFASIVAIVLGIVALNQLKKVVQDGRGMAVAGIVLGSLWIVGFGALIAIGIATDSGDSTASGSSKSSTPTAPAAHVATIDELRAGDCFDGGAIVDSHDVGDVTVVPCTSPHTSQVITVFELPAGRYPGEDKVVAAAEKGCSEKADPLVREDRMTQVEPYYIYPSDAWTWAHSRAIQCTADATSGKVTGSVLK
ncbi:DUF4190 domain-containing protein [Intrasporangium flavum]|uniref:DUF4190 domain-containing protein n=1 Tax=Intrasporangium flavum TaxID=1428657 RepID=UPI00096E219C|nr:DUF4190 domain-containing protein [Intrasporangium flavum]